jgi:hypothetical protein
VGLGRRAIICVGDYNIQSKSICRGNIGDYSYLPRSLMTGLFSM